MKNILFFIFFTVFFAGCGYNIPSAEQRKQIINRLSFSQNLTKETYSTGIFKIFTFSSDLNKCAGKTADVYIEGDGLSWITSDTVSPNPTPINPTAFKLFLQDYHICKIYMARPCQYTVDPKCSVKYWTGYRFSPEVIASFNRALNSIKAKYKLHGYRLFGYSGGGAVAALLAAKRKDISLLVTVCGNLDIKKWAENEYITPLRGSLNPADFSGKLQYVKQYHLIGGDDMTVPKSVFESYFNRFKNKKNIKFEIFQNFNHHCCWVKQWKEILKNIDRQTENQF